MSYGHAPAAGDVGAHAGAPVAAPAPMAPTMAATNPGAPAMAAPAPTDVSQHVPFAAGAAPMQTAAPVMTQEPETPFPAGAVPHPGAAPDQPVPDTAIPSLAAAFGAPPAAALDVTTPIPQAPMEGALVAADAPAWTIPPAALPTQGGATVEAAIELPTAPAQSPAPAPAQTPAPGQAPAPAQSPGATGAASSPLQAPSMASLALPADPALDAQASETAADAVGASNERPAAEAESQWGLTPRLGLLVGVLGMTWQLVALYARELLPGKVASGATLDRFDSLVGSVGVLESSAGALIGLVLCVGALVIVALGARVGVRQPVLQGAAVVVALVGAAVGALGASMLSG